MIRNFLGFISFFLLYVFIFFCALLLIAVLCYSFALVFCYVTYFLFPGFFISSPFFVSLIPLFNLAFFFQMINGMISLSLLFPFIILTFLFKKRFKTIRKFVYFKLGVFLGFFLQFNIKRITFFLKNPFFFNLDSLFLYMKFFFNCFFPLDLWNFFNLLKKEEFFLISLNNDDDITFVFNIKQKQPKKIILKKNFFHRIIIKKLLAFLQLLTIMSFSTIYFQNIKKKKIFFLCFLIYIPI